MTPSDLPSASSSTGSAERVAMIRLARTAGIGPVNFSRLLATYGTALRTLEALPHRVQRTGRPMPDIPTISEIEDEIARLAQQGARHLLRSDPDYPLLLTHVPDAPPLLFARGHIDRLSLSSVGIVGARNASTAGLRLAESIAAELAADNLCIVSGLARGIDAAAHQGALHRGLTVAAIAGGLDCPYPPEHAKLHHDIAERGCLITEAPPGTMPQARHFPRRNRLIAGLTQGCLVIEAAERSGTLITARLAESYLRMVFATPGSPLDPRSRGGNRLIRQGCVLVESASDILADLPRHLPARQPAPWTHDSTSDTPLFQTVKESPPTVRQSSPQPCNEKKPRASQREQESQENEAIPDEMSPSTPREHLLTLLSITPMPVDEIVSRCQFSVSTVATALSELELDGIIERLPGGRVARLPEITP